MKTKIGYLFYKTNKSKTSIVGKDGRTYTGLYIHRIVVFTFGDCRGQQYSSTGKKNIIDHIDMDHKNNDVDNLELVSDEINLFRSWWKTGSEKSKRLLEEKYNGFSQFERDVFREEIRLEMERNPKWY